VKYTVYVNSCTPVNVVAVSDAEILALGAVRGTDCSHTYFLATSLVDKGLCDKNRPPPPSPLPLPGFRGATLT